MLEAPAAPLIPFDPTATYIRRPPFAAPGKDTRLERYVACPSLTVGDDVTTVHILPTSAVLPGSETARYLAERGEYPKDLHAYAARRGDCETMLRAPFVAKASRNLLGPCITPGSTVHTSFNEKMPLWRAAARYE